MARLEAAGKVGSSPSQRLASAALVAGLTALLVLPALGRQPIVDSDEARFALLARDMLARGVWFGARVEGRVYLNKPPLYPWLIAVASWPWHRVSEATALLPVTLAAISAAVLLTVIGERLFGGQVGLAAGLALATTPGFVDLAGHALPDMLMTAFSLVAIWIFCTSVVAGGHARAPLGFWIAVALALFAKGPGGLLPVLAAAVWCLTSGGVRELRRLWHPGGLLGFGLVTVIWLGPYLWIGRQTFLTAVLRDEWGAWYVGEQLQSSRSQLTLEFIVTTIPWLALLPLSLHHAIRRWADPIARWTLVWFAVSLIATFLSQNQDARYLLPVYPPAALLVGWWLVCSPPVPHRGSALMLTLGGVVLLGTAVLGLVPLPLGLLAQHPVGGLAVGFMVVIVVATLLGGLWTGRRALLLRGVVIGMTGLLLVGPWLQDTWFRGTSDFRDIMRETLRQTSGRDLAVAVAVGGRRNLQLDFHAGRELPRLRTPAELSTFLRRPGGAVVLTPSQTWGALSDASTPPVTVLARRSLGGEEWIVVGAM